ncbi:Release factor glutamine methyltransferase [Bienertia sinuspersici]
MKRSKKAGGYNLRKSLAWDRAFLAEEGVLNDSELSMISGCDIDRLCAIDEQGSDLLPTQSVCTEGFPWSWS